MTEAQSNWPRWCQAAASSSCKVEKEISRRTRRINSLSDEVKYPYKVQGKGNGNGRGSGTWLPKVENKVEYLYLLSSEKVSPLHFQAVSTGCCHGRDQGTTCPIPEMQIPQ